MIYAVSGILVAKRQHFFIVDAGQINFKIFASQNTIASLPDIGGRIKAFTFLNVREDALELYGFLSERELELFERLNGVSGIGPKSALTILGIAKIDQLVAAINEGRSELLTRASGIGRKTAERVVLELKGKLDAVASPQALSLMESDLEIEETLVSLGYTRAQAKLALSKINPKTIGFKERLKEALRGTKG